jgi:hypothetical protein
MFQASLIIQHLRRRWSQGRRLQLPDPPMAAGPGDGLSADPRIQVVLAELTAGFSLDSPLRQEVADEMLGHLEDSIDAKLAAGMPRDAAIDAALREFGPVAEVADGLRNANRTRWLADLVVRFVLTPLAAMLCAILAALSSMGAMRLCHCEDPVITITLPAGLQLTLSWIPVVAAWIGSSFGGWLIQRRPFVTETASFFGVCAAVLCSQGLFLGKPLLLPLAIPIACLAYDLGMMLVTDWRSAGAIGRFQSVLLGAVSVGSLWMLACTAFVLPLTGHAHRCLAGAAVIGSIYGGIWGWRHSHGACRSRTDT